MTVALEKTDEQTMTPPRISKHEWPVMEALWRWGALSIREIKTGICDGAGRPAYTTVQTMVYRRRSLVRWRNGTSLQIIFDSSKDGSGLSSSIRSRWGR